jgi:FkbM family methyltransferase
MASKGHRLRYRIQKIREILDHPANRAQRLRGFVRYLKWNLGRRLLTDADYAIQITPTVRVILSNHENYATLAYTCGLYDFDEMSFLLHYLRPGDCFGDFGANVGVYSVLAGSVGARVLSVEPVPDTFAKLQRNLRLNSVPGQPVRCGLADQAGTLRFTKSLGGMNRVAMVRDGDDSIEVGVKTSDQLTAETGLNPVAIKIDVEGFELPLLRGSTNLLRSVEAIVIELNGSGRPYGYADDAVHALLLDAGFGCFDYNPAQRALTARDGYHRDRFNTLYLRKAAVDKVVERLSQITVAAR